MKKIYLGDAIAFIVIAAFGTVLISPAKPIEVVPAPHNHFPEKTFVVPFDSVAVAPARAYPVARDYVYRIRAMPESDLAKKMRAEGFTWLDGLNRNQLRQLYACFKYHQLFVDVAAATDLPVQVVWGYFGFEALREGVETDLFRVHANPGGIKWNGGEKTRAFDDCGGIPCDFKKLDTYHEMVVAWSKVFNLRRYRQCKAGDDAEIIQCIDQSGYCTAPCWGARAELAKKYFFFKKRFPRGCLFREHELYL